MNDVDLGWNDVLRRARRGRRRYVLAAACAGAAILVASAVAVPLLQSDAPKLPRAADRSRVAVIVDPRTGRVLVQAAPWKGRDGVCYVIVQRTSGCSMRSKHGGMFSSTPPGGYTFDARVRSATAILANGRRLALLTRRLPGLGITFFTGPRVTRATRIELDDAAGRLVVTLRVERP